MDWPLIAAIIAAGAAVLSASVALWISPPMQKYLHRHDTFKQLQPYERDILKAILCSHLGLGSIVIREGSIEPIMELTLTPGGNISKHRMLIVSQSFYQLSLESLESIGLLTRNTVVEYLPVPLPKGQTPPEHYAYRITGQGTQFIHKYTKRLRGESFAGCYIDLTFSDPVITRYKAWIFKGQLESYTIPTSYPPAWVKERQKGDPSSYAIIPGHNRGFKKDDKVNIVCDPAPYVGHNDYRPYVNNLSRRAEVLSIEELDAVYDYQMRVEDHTLVSLRFID